MINRVKLSVVLPCYNVEKYIRKGLDSVLAQTLQEWEAILVDDGATDSTARICDEYAKKDNRFHVIHTENQGVIVSIPDILYQYYLRNNGAASQERTQLRLFEDHFVLMVHRSRMRQMIREIDLMDYYLGSNILSCLRLAITLSKKWKWYRQFQSFVTHSDVQEAIHRVSLKNAPLRFAIPVRLLKVHCQWFLFFGCWMAHKLGVRLPDTL